MAQITAIRLLKTSSGLIVLAEIDGRWRVAIEDGYGLVSHTSEIQGAEDWPLYEGKL